jgi:hypothetical protein
MASFRQRVNREPLDAPFEVIGDHQHGQINQRVKTEGVAGGGTDVTCSQVY